MRCRGGLVGRRGTLCEAPPVTSKERVKAALDHREPDRVPIGEFAVDHDTVERVLGRPTFWRAHFATTRALWDGRRDDVVSSMKRDLVDLTLAMGYDMVPVCLVPSADKPAVPMRRTGENEWRDEWGNVFQYSTASEWLVQVHHVNETRDFTVDDFAYVKADEPDDSELELVRYVVERLGGTHYIFARSGDGSIVLPGGMVRGLMMMVEEPEIVRAAIDSATQRAVDLDAVFAREGVDGVCPAADYAMETGPMMSPRVFHDLCFPALARHAEAAHRMGLDLLKHACGNNWAILDDFRRAGCDAYQSIQGRAGMDIRRLKELYGSSMTLWGGVQTEHLLAAAPDDVRADVMYAIRHAAEGGGFILGSSHSVAVGTKYENYLAMFDALREFGSYPIDPDRFD